MRTALTNALFVLSIMGIITQIAICLVLLRLTREIKQGHRIILVQQTSDGLMPFDGGQVAVHFVGSIGKNGNLYHFNGEQDAITPLRFRELEGYEADLADVYIVPRHAPDLRA
jgi:hypothetical protein